MDAPKLFEGKAFESWNDPYGNRLISINRDGTISVQGLVFPDGSYQASAPAITQSDVDAGTF
jgi:hypothetical protein